ncbi:MAG: hypothetical protein JNK74_26015 [Candidatus Hydrogenedentes bacterium]|nr:hypothetical protein [Candidatus Hydrogenedentota bacterium]
MKNILSRNHPMVMWKKILCAVLALVVLCAGAFVVRFGSRAYRLKKSGAAMKQARSALQRYADSNPGNYYPLRSAEAGVFLPDMTARAAQGDGLAEFQEALKYFDGDEQRPLCYLGYAFYDEASAQRLLDQLEKDPQAFRGGGTRLEQEPFLDPHSLEFDELAPLRTGVGRRFMNAWFESHGLPPGDFDIDGAVPMLWQMPERIGDRVPVLYMNGVVWFRDYPGEFPMTPLFINRLRGLMGLPQDPGFDMDTPIMPVLREILETGSREPGRGVGTLGPYDSVPSVTQGDAKGYRIALGFGEVVLFPEDVAPGSLDPVTLFGKPEEFYQGLPRGNTVRFMGTSRGYHWYGKLDYQVFTLLRNTFDLKGGDSLYEAAVIYWINNEPISNWLRPYRKDPSNPSEILRSPPSLDDYIDAYIANREGMGKPIDPEIIHAAILLCGTDYEGYGTYIPPDAELLSEARDRLLSAAERDPEAAATLLLPHVMRYRFRNRREEASPERMEILRHLPRETVLPIVKHLADYIKDENDAALCRDLFNKLD